jgi:Spy/CpxP family protein refolding chaperone
MSFLAFGHGASGSGWRGMGPGMMGGAGMWGAGPGWAAGNGYGMMGTNGAGMPAMGYGTGYATMPWVPPDLTPEQVQKIGQLQGDPQGRQQNLMQQRWESQAELSRLYAAEPRDWGVIRAAATAQLELQRRQLDATIELQQKLDALLTDSQRKEMAKARRSLGWAGTQ